MATPGAALQRVLAALQRAGKTVRPSGGDAYLAQCPAHDDRNPSMSVSARSGKVMLHCHAGCDIADILPELGLTWPDLFDEPLPVKARTAARSTVREHAYPDANGNPVGVEIRRNGNGAPFLPFKPNPDGTWSTGASEQLKSTPYRLPELVAAVARGETIWIAEGGHDVDTLIDRCGVAATSNWGGAGKWGPTHTHWIKGMHVVVCLDRDKPNPKTGLVPGDEHGKTVLATLPGIAASVRVKRPPPPHKDVTDLIDSGGSLDDLLDVPLNELVKVSPNGDPHPNEHALTIPGVPDESESRRRRAHKLGNEVNEFRWLLAELGARGLTGIFLRGSRAVCVPQITEEGYAPPRRQGDDNGPATVRTLDARGMVTRLALYYRVFRMVQHKQTKEWYELECFFPNEAAAHTLDALDEAVNIRLLKGVTHTPIVRSDGSILERPGYDEASGCLYLPTVVVPTIPASPTLAQRSAAKALLRGMISQFSWVGEHDEANYIGLMLTPLLRLLCPPPYKLGAIMAHQPGSGKSLLARILRDVHGGVFRSEMPHDDPELAKSITSILNCTTAPVVQFDNVTGMLRSSRLAGLLTSAIYSDRVLGTTNNIDMDNDRLWIITGNNLNLGSDLVRRTIWVTIDPQCPDPHLRTGFNLDLPSYVAEHRGSILAALLTLVAAWHSSGARFEKTSSDDYAHWTAVVRAILQHADIPGEFDHAESAQQKAGGDDEGWGEFLATVYAVFGDEWWTVRDLTERMAEMRPEADGGGLKVAARELVEALPAELYEKYLKARSSPAAIKRSLATWMHNREGRWVGGLAAHSEVDKATNAKKWIIRTSTDRNSRTSRSTGSPGVPGVIDSLRARARNSTFYNSVINREGEKSGLGEWGTLPALPVLPVDLEEDVTVSNRDVPPDPSALRCSRCDRSDARTMHGLALCLRCANGA